MHSGTSPSAHLEGRWLGSWALCPPDVHSGTSPSAHIEGRGQWNEGWGRPWTQIWRDQKKYFTQVLTTGCDCTSGGARLPPQMCSHTPPKKKYFQVASISAVKAPPPHPKCAIWFTKWSLCPPEVTPSRCAISPPPAPERCFLSLGCVYLFKEKTGTMTHCKRVTFALMPWVRIHRSEQYLDGGNSALVVGFQSRPMLRPQKHDV